MKEKKKKNAFFLLNFQLKKSEKYKSWQEILLISWFLKSYDEMILQKQ